MVVAVKVDPSSMSVVVQEELTEVADVEELKESIPDTQPRYVLLSWKINHKDGRVSFPMAFIYTTPRGKMTCLSPLSDNNCRVWAFDITHCCLTISESK